MNQKEILIEEYKNLIQVCEFFRLDEYTDKLKVKLRDLEEPLKFMIVGAGKSGKSTLLNALVGKEIAEVDDEPKTWCINVYHNTKENPYAELVYENKTERVSIEEAYKISERISSKDSDSVLEADEKLLEIRWHVALDWPKENVILIDTPGFDQIRRDTGYKKIAIDGIEGIQYEAEDGFEGFQYKADLLLWCINSKKIGDEQVEEKLKNAPMDASRMYGIVTRLDEVKENKREKTFLSCENRYLKYLKRCIRSSLPPIDVDDTEEEKREKTQMRKETIEGIRWCIEFLLKDNASLELIKVKSSAAYLDTVKEQVVSTLGSYLVFYVENYKLYTKVKNNFLEDLEKEAEKYKREIVQTSDSYKTRMSSDAYLSELWMLAMENAEVYNELLKQKIFSNNITDKCNRILKQFQKEETELLDYAFSNMNWKKMLISRSEDSGFRLENQKAPQIAKMQLLSSPTINIVLEDMGFAYIISQAAQSIGLGSAAKFFLGDHLRKKAIEVGQRTVISYAWQHEKESENFIHASKEQASEKFDNSIRQSFQKHTGLYAEEICERVLAIEKTLTEWGWYGKEVSYYPFIKDRKVNFFQSKYYEELGLWEVLDENFFMDWIKNEVIGTAIQKRKENAFKMYRVAIAEYNGLKEISMPQEKAWPEYIEKDLYIIEKIPQFKNIEWGNLYKSIEKDYASAIKKLKNSCEKEWKNLSEKALTDFMEEQKSILEQSYQGSFDLFLSLWAQRLRDVCNYCIERGALHYLPQETELGYYYHYYYYPTYHQDGYMWAIQEYYRTRELPSVLLSQFSYISPEGKSLQPDFETICKDMMDRMLVQAEQEKRRIMKSWDNAISDVYEQIMKQYESCFVQIEQMIENHFLEAWEDYKLKVTSMGAKQIFSLNTYMIKSGRLPALYCSILGGKITKTTLGPAGHYTYSDGRPAFDEFSEWLRRRVAKIDKR